MKKITLLVLTLILALQSYSQEPIVGFSYQAVALDKSKAEQFGRDSQGEVLSSTHLRVRFTLTQDTPEGIEVYQETHETQTDMFGMFRLIVGRGERLMGDNIGFLPWGVQVHFLHVEVDKGEGFEYLGNEELLGAPYAMNASPQNLILVGNELSIAGGNAVILSDMSPTNELVKRFELDGENLILEDAGGTHQISLESLHGLGSSDDQNLSLSGTTLNIEDGTGVDLALLQDGTGTDDQNLTLTGNTLSIEDGNNVDLSGFVNTDTQNLSTDVAIPGDISLTDGGNITINVDDADADPSNELVTEFTINGSNLELVDAGGTRQVAIHDLQDGTGTDDQNLTLTGSSLSIEGGNNVDLSGFQNTDTQDLSTDVAIPGDISLTDGGNITINVDDADANPSNELVTGFAINGTNLELTDAGGTREVPLGDLAGPGSDDQNLSLSGTTLNIEDGTGVDLALLQDGTGTDDQNLTLTGNILSIEDGNNVDLSGFVNTDTQDLSTDLTIPGDISLTGGGNIAINVDDADASATNELVTGFTVNGSNLELIDAGGTRQVALGDLGDGTGTDDQNLTLTGNILSIEDGNNVDLSGFANTDTQDLSTDGTTGDIRLTNGGNITINVNDADADATNEIQDLALDATTNILTVTNNAFATNIDLSRYISPFVTSNNVTSNENGDYATDDFVFGSPTMVSDGNFEHYNRMFFDKSKGAFRAGVSGADNWDDENVGEYSVGLGGAPLASGDYSVAMGFATYARGVASTAFGANSSASGRVSVSIGYQSSAREERSIALGARAIADADEAVAIGSEPEANGEFSTAIGRRARAFGQNSMAFGNYTTAFGENSTAMGTGTQAHGVRSTAMGSGTRAYSYAETTLGMYNTDYIPNHENNWHASDRLLAIGNGIHQTALSDALIILKNGNTTLHGELTIDADNVDGAGTPYTLPGQDGQDGQVLTTDGVGNATWENAVANTDTQDLSTDGTIPGNISLTDGGTITINVEDADASATNELVTGFTVNGSNLELIDAGGTRQVALGDLGDGTGTDDQNLTLTGNILSIEDGNNVDLSGFVNTDTQDLSTDGTTGDIRLTNGGNITINVDDADASATNELVTGFTVNGSNLELIDAGGTRQVALGDLGDGTGTDDQNLTLTGNILSIEDGNNVDLSGFVNTDTQDLSTDGTAGNISLTDGGTIAINVNDADADAENEIQDLALNETTNILTITDNTSATEIDLGAYLSPFSTTGTTTSNENGTYATDDFIFGSPQMDDDGNEDHDNRMFFDKSKGAFRAGRTYDDDWDDANVGNNSIALGLSNVASGINSVAMGNQSIASGNAATAIGQRVVASEGGSTALGSDTEASGRYATSIGYYSTASGWYSVALGMRNSAPSYGETVLGLYATNYIPSPSAASSIVSSDRLFTIGNGFNPPGSPAVRRDALVMLKNGTTTLNGTLTIDADNVDGAGTPYTLPGQDGTDGQVLTTDGAGNATWENAAANTDTQDLSADGTIPGNISLTDGGTITINVDDADASATNEIQDLELNETTNILTITDNTSASEIDLSPYISPFATTDNVTSNEGGDYASDDFVFGSPQIDDDGDTDHDNRMFFDKSKGAVRAGISTGTQWNDANVGDYSVSFGTNTIASGPGAFSVGRFTQATGDYSVAMGYLTDATGDESVAIGFDTDASAERSMAIGSGVNANGQFSSALGYLSTANGIGSVVLGRENQANGNFSTAMGEFSQSTGQASTAMGSSTRAVGDVATSMGLATRAEGNFSTAMGFHTNAYSHGETSMGSYNSEYVANSTTAYDPDDRLLVVGNGFNPAVGPIVRQDALVMLKNGNTTLHGELTIDADNVDGAGTPYTLPGQDGTDGQVLTTDGAGNATWENAVANTDTQDLSTDATMPGNISLTDGGTITINVNDADADAENEIQDLALNETTNILTITDNTSASEIDLSPYISPFATTDNVTSNENGTYSTDDFVFGSPTSEWSGSFLHSSRMFFDKSKSAFRVGYDFSGRWDDDQVGVYSIALGYNTLASEAGSIAIGFSAVSEGEQALAIGESAQSSNINSTAIGYANHASGVSSLALGQETTASGRVSTSVGYSTQATGDYSTSQGLATSAFSFGEQVIGVYNTSYVPVSETSSDPADRLFVIGNGSFSPALGVGTPSDALVMLKNGNTTLHGELTIDADNTGGASGYTLPAQDGANGQVLTTDGAGNTSWQEPEIPVGGIIMWSGAIADIPTGWALCDGTNSTPDLSGQFIVAYQAGSADYGTVGATGGQNQQTITADQLPAHQHQLDGAGATTVVSDDSHEHFFSFDFNQSNVDNGFDELVVNSLDGGPGIGGVFGGNTDPDTHSHTLTGNTGTGVGLSGNPFDNRPAYYTLAFIIKL